MVELEKKLHNLFGNIEFVALENIAEKIAVISKVRIGDDNKRTDQFYEEISLADLDEYGIIHPPAEKNDLRSQLGWAHVTALNTQSLQKGDLVLARREAQIKIGLFDGRYDSHPLIGNSSMIRIVFNNTRKINTPLFIQAYLQLPLIQEYLLSFTYADDAKDPKKRKMLSASVLLNLPVPCLEEIEYPYNFKELYYRRIDMCKKLNTLQQKMNLLSDGCDYIKEEALCFYTTVNSNTWPMKSKEDETMIKEFLQISNTLDEYLAKYKIPLLSNMKEEQQNNG